MVYYSEELGKKFDTEEECLTAEKEYFDALEEAKKKKEALKVERKQRAKEVEDAFKASEDARKHYIELRNQFIKDYNFYHMTYSSTEELDKDSLKGLVDELFNFKKIF